MSLLRLITVATLATFAACGGGGGEPVQQTLASITLTPEPLTLLNVGDVATVTAAGKDANGNSVSTGTLNWTSSNASVATVDPTGKVTAKGLGVATITAMATNGVSKGVAVQVTQASFNVQSSFGCSSPTMRTGKLVATSAHALIIEDTGNPTGGFTTSDYQAFANDFESLVWPVLTENFGTPSDVDNNGRVIIFFTRAVNELSPESSTSVVGGFFFARDLFPKVATPRLQACAGSNVAEMFYMLVPDPNGTVNKNVRTLAQVRNQTVGVIGHEFQHLINSSTRLYKNLTAKWPEATYMEEGLSHIAEELLFYRASSLTSMSNIDLVTLQQPATRAAAFNSYMASNAGRQRLYLSNPSAHSPYADDDELETRGATWSFLRYLADVPGPPAETICSLPVSLAVGGTCVLQGPGAVDLKAGTLGEEFTLVAVAEGSSVSVTAAPTTVIAVTGPPNPYQGPMSASLSRLLAAPRLSENTEFHSRLRDTERRELRGRVSSAREDYVRVHRARLAPTGAVWSLGAAEDVWAKLVNSNDTSFANLQSVFGANVMSRVHDWATAHYTDDAVAGVPVKYTHPSWNWRSIYPALTGGPSANTFPLKTLALTSAQTVALVDGGAAYFRAGVAATATARVTFTSSGGATPSALKVVVVRTK